eukprot:11765858-Alexandrium_andersonii.AAC.1
MQAQGHEGEPGSRQQRAECAEPSIAVADPDPDASTSAKLVEHHSLHVGLQAMYVGYQGRAEHRPRIRAEAGQHAGGGHAARSPLAAPRHGAAELELRAVA